jgi:hypothetical protein
MDASSSTTSDSQPRGHGIGLYSLQAAIVIVVAGQPVASRILTEARPTSAIVCTLRPNAAAARAAALKTVAFPTPAPPRRLPHRS